MKKLLLLLCPLLLLAACTKDYSVERSVVIDAPNAVVWDNIKYYKNWVDWSPWYAKDSTMEWTFEGEDGKEGSSYSWTSENSGSGEMENRGVVEGESMQYHTHFLEPWESETDGYLNLEQVGEGTKVTWGFSGKMKFPMSLFMNMDKMVGPDFEEGLNYLKNKCESMEGTSAFNVQTIDYAGAEVVGIKKVVSFQDMANFFGESYGKLMEKHPIKEGTYPMGLYYSWEPEKMQSEMAAAYETPSEVKDAGAGMEVMSLPAGKALMIDYFGSYEQSEAAHTAINEYMASNKLEYVGPAIEIYVTDPMAEPDTSKWNTQIIYPVK